LISAGFQKANDKIVRLTGRNIQNTKIHKECNAMETKLYVGNLSYETTESDLRNLFAQAGVVNEVALIKDRDTGSSKGFAFVTMSNQAEADKALQQFNGHSLGSRDLKVNIARPRESSFDSNSRGGYRSSGGGQRN
jgi:RNA recognition motif-containing protein